MSQNRPKTPEELRKEAVAYSEAVREGATEHAQGVREHASAQAQQGQREQAVAHAQQVLGAVNGQAEHPGPVAAQFEHPAVRQQGMAPLSDEAVALLAEAPAPPPPMPGEPNKT